MTIMRTRPSDTALIALMCWVQLLTMLSLSIFAAQLTHLRDVWGLSNTEVGWISSAYFLGYVVVVPFLSRMTDIVDAKLVVMGGSLLLALGMVLFGCYATGFWNAMLFHAIAGAGLAGAYMPGLKALADRVSDKNRSRASSFYTASFGLGAAVSYIFSDLVGQYFGWPYAFIGSGIAAIGASLSILFFFPSKEPEKVDGNPNLFLDFGPAIRNRSAMAYTIGYTLHCWELFTLRAWVVAFLAYTAVLHNISPTYFSPAMIATLMTLLGVPSSVLGNELGMKYGRNRVVIGIMFVSIIAFALVGFTSEISYTVAAIACIVLGIIVIMDSSILTAGALGRAEPGYRGATMAIHAMLGFSGSMVGPLLFGLLLDFSGGENLSGWVLAYSHIALIMAMAILIIFRMKLEPVFGDKS